MKPRKKILIIITGVVTALLLIANSFIRFNPTANLSENQKQELHSPGFLLLN